MIQFPPHPPAPSCYVIQAPLHHAHHLARHVRPRVHQVLDAVLLQLVLVAVVRVYHHLALSVLPKYHVGAENSAELAQEAEGVVEELLRGDVDHQDQLAHSELLRHVVGTVQAVPLTLSVVTALIAVAISVVVFTVLVIEWTEEKRVC